MRSIKVGIKINTAKEDLPCLVVVDHVTSSQVIWISRLSHRAHVDNITTIRIKNEVLIPSFMNLPRRPTAQNTRDDGYDQQK